MDIKQMSFFVETASCGSIKKASDALHITPSGLRLSLHRLEDELDAKLIIWGSNSFTLTKDGNIFLYYARDILRSYNECMSKLSQGQRSTVVRTASGINFPVNYIGSTMLEFQAANPTYEMVHADYSSARCDEAILSGEAEIGFNTGPFDKEKFVYYPVAEYSLYVILNVSEKDAGEKFFPFSRLGDYRLILADIKPSDDTFSKLCARYGITPNITSRVQRDIAMMNAVSNDRGFLGITHREVFESVSKPGVVFMPFENDLFTKTVYLFHRKGAHLSDAAQAYKSFVLDKVRDAVYKVH